MTPRLARYALAGFFLVAIGIAGNALLLQGRLPARDKAETASIKPTAERARRESQRVAGGGRAPAPAHSGRLNPDSALLDALPETPQSNADTVRAVQRELALKGYGTLSSDGVLGLSTRAAIMAYEHDNSLPLMGEATEALLKRLVIGASGADPSGAGKVRSAAAERVVRGVQQQLAQRGYRPGRLDGRMSEETAEAIRQFELDGGSIPRGRISAELLKCLGDPACPAKHAPVR
jgi:peptidoglycan hydrolase-like protein with peptidoglycan-binding domain